MVKWVCINKYTQSPCIEAQGTEDGGQSTEHLSGDRDLKGEEGQEIMRGIRHH